MNAGERRESEDEENVIKIHRGETQNLKRIYRTCRKECLRDKCGFGGAKNASGRLGHDVETARLRALHLVLVFPERSLIMIR